MEFSFLAAVTGLLTVSDTIPGSQSNTSHSESVWQEYSDKGSNMCKLQIGFKLQGNWETDLQLQQMDLVDIFYKYIPSELETWCWRQ